MKNPAILLLVILTAHTIRMKPSINIMTWITIFSR